MAFIAALILWVIAITTVISIGGRFWWFPEAISNYGDAFNTQFDWTFAIVGGAFFLAQMALGYCVFRFRGKRRGEAVYSHGSSRLEAIWTIGTAIVFITLGITGQKVWAQLHLNQAPPDAIQIEVTGQQFAWNVRYPGPDGKFGRTKPELIDDALVNYLGLDDTDPAARDDIVIQNIVVVPVNRPVKITLTSKDVTHSFFVPWLRLKQDAVPGLRVPIHFAANKVGKYEIACAELCGQLHWQMRGDFLVKTDEEFENWLKEQSSFD